MQFKEKYHYLAVFVLFIFISFFLANYVGFNRHWIVNHDQEFTLIYNALLFNSHLPLEYIQHPGFFTILFLSLFIKLLSFFDLITVYNLSLLNSENFDGGFQELIFFTRIYSTISVSLFCHFLGFVLLSSFISDNFLHVIPPDLYDLCVLGIGYLFLYLIINYP